MKKKQDQYVLFFRISHDSLIVAQESPKSDNLFTPSSIKDYSNIDIFVFAVLWDKKLKCNVDNFEPIQVGYVNGILFEPFEDVYKDREIVDEEDRDICELYNIISEPDYCGDSIFHILEFTIEESWRGRGFAKFTLSKLNEILINSVKTLPYCLTVFEESATMEDTTNNIDEMRQIKRMRNLFTSNGFKYEKNIKLLRSVVNVQKLNF